MRREETTFKTRNREMAEVCLSGVRNFSCSSFSQHQFAIFSSNCFQIEFSSRFLRKINTFDRTKNIYNTRFCFRKWTVLHIWFLKGWLLWLHPFSKECEKKKGIFWMQSRKTERPCITQRRRKKHRQSFKLPFPFFQPNIVFLILHLI